ncbi:KH domain-containing protein [soil metagenome]
MSEQVSQSPATDLEELVRYMATNLVEEPDDVTVAAEQRGSSVQINLRVSAKELGKVIGREGRIARSMRTIVMVAGSRNNVRANLDIDGNA